MTDDIINPNRKNLAGREDLPAALQPGYDYLRGIFNRLVKASSELAPLESNINFFLMSDSNATMFITDGVYNVAFGPQVFKEAENLSEDHVAAVLAHELGHIVSFLNGNDRLDKVNELAADIRSMELLQRAGYAPKAAYEVFAKMEPNAFGKMKNISEYLDEHPVAANREFVAQGHLTEMRFRYGRLRDEETPLAIDLNETGRYLAKYFDTYQVEKQEKDSLANFDWKQYEEKKALAKQQFAQAREEMVKNFSPETFLQWIEAYKSRWDTPITAKTFKQLIEMCDYRQIYNSRYDNVKNIKVMRTLVDMAEAPTEFELSRLTEILNNNILSWSLQSLIVSVAENAIKESKRYPQTDDQLSLLYPAIMGNRGDLNTSTIMAFQAEFVKRIAVSGNAGLLDSVVRNGGILDTKLRQAVLDAYADYMVKFCGGKDNGSDKYRTEFSLFANNQEYNRIPYPHYREIIRLFCDKAVAQRKVVDCAKKLLDVENTAVDQRIQIGCDAAANCMGRSTTTVSAFVDFIQKEYSPDSAAKLKTTFLKAAYDDDEKKLIQDLEPANFYQIYSEFWKHSLSERAAVLAKLINDGARRSGGNSNQLIFYKYFKDAINNMLPEGSPNKEFITNVIKEYINAYSDIEKPFLLAAMLSAIKENGSPNGNGYAMPLKEFLENIGPAGIKLGQALGSSPDVPPDVREVMQGMKNHADQPARWDLFEMIDAAVPPEHQGTIGKVIGSGSYFITVDKGSSVLGVLRPYARERAEDGFNVMRKACDALAQYPGQDYKNFTAIFSNIIGKAQQMSEIETDMEIGAVQDRMAHQLYNGRSLKIGRDVYHVAVADWVSRGDEYKEVKKVDGIHFNDLPRGKFKSTFAKAYFKLEMENIFSGGFFDHDRHGAQLKIDISNKTVGIFDNGAMSTWRPQAEEKKQLGQVLNKVISRAVKGKDVGEALIDAVQNEMKRKGSSEYILAVQRGLLALNDYMREISGKDRAMVFMDTLLSEKADPAIVGEISFKNKFLLKTARRFLNDGDSNKPVASPLINREEDVAQKEDSPSAYPKLMRAVEDYYRRQPQMAAPLWHKETSVSR